MDSLFVSLLPFIIGAALAPVQIIIVILLLGSPSQGLLKASAFVAGMTIVRLLQGLVFGLLFAGDTAAGEKSLELLVVIAAEGGFHEPDAEGARVFREGAGGFLFQFGITEMASLKKY